MDSSVFWICNHNCSRSIFYPFSISITYLFSNSVLQIPFTAIQFPLYERLKVFSYDYLYSSSSSQQRPPHLPSSCSALCGCIAGGIAAAVTTPLDVAKTRIMLGQSISSSVSLSTLFSKMCKMHLLLN